MPRAFLIKKKQQCARNGIPLAKSVWSDEDSADENMDTNRCAGFAPLTPPEARGPYDLSMKPKQPFDETSNDSDPAPRPAFLPGNLVAPKAIKPLEWQRHAPSYTYPLYAYSYNSPQHFNAPPPLVPLGSPDRYSPRFESVRPGWYSDGQDSGLASSSPSPSSEDGDNRIAAAGVQTRYQCPDCAKSYSTYSGLSKHRLTHCNGQEALKKSFGCKYCDKTYVSLGALKMHIRTHTLPCKCELCGKAFSRPWLLQGHIRTHTGEKPFSCHHCSRAFADRSNLRAHLQTHSEVKKYRCGTCSKTFSRMSLLLKHEDGGCAGAAANCPL